MPVIVETTSLFVQSIALAIWLTANITATQLLIHLIQGKAFGPNKISFSSIQSLSCVQLFAAPWTAAHRPPCPSPTPGVYSNSCPLSQWCHPAISPPSSLLLPSSIFPSIRVFSNESTPHIRWPKYWSFSFSISPSSEHPGLISFRMDQISLQSKGLSQESSPTPRFKRINSSALSFLYSPTLTSIYDHWKNHSLD